MAKAEMAKAEIGEVVWWYPDGDKAASPHPAVVTAAGEHALTLNVMGPDIKTFRIEDGVHHIDDPACRRLETRDSGGWDHTERTKRLEKLFKELGGK
jgi:hypothetical protein